MEAREVLEKVKNNEISIEEAEKYFKKEPFEEMGYAKLDTHREIRSGFAEVIFCARKADEHLLKIFTRLYEQDGEVFGTRASEHQYEIVKEVIPEPVGGAQRCHAALFERMDAALRAHLKELCRMSDRQLADQRYKKYRQIGETRNA